MSGFVLTARGRPGQRLDLTGVIPSRLAVMPETEIAALVVSTTRTPATLGEMFSIQRAGPDDRIVVEGATDRHDHLAAGLDGGEMVVEGDAGAWVGRGMKSGGLRISGDAGPFAAAGLAGGEVVIEGNAGDRLMGATTGATKGATGGVVTLRGDAGARAGERMRRGMLIVRGRLGPAAGARMIAGTIVGGGGADEDLGWFMRRGTILLGVAPALSPEGFVDCGLHDLTASRLLRAAIARRDAETAARFEGLLRRHAGDLATGAKGELLVAEA